MCLDGADEAAVLIHEHPATAGRGESGVERGPQGPSEAGHRAPTVQVVTIDDAR